MNIGLTIIALAVLFLIRNELVARIRVKELDITHQYCVLMIDAGRYDKVDEAYERYDSISYTDMLLDLTKWTHKQFYGRVEE